MFTFVCSSDKLASISMQAVQTTPFCTDWFLLLPAGYILTATGWPGYFVRVCLPCALGNFAIVPRTLLLDTLLLLWLGSFLLGPWLSPLQWISRNPFKGNTVNMCQRKNCKWTKTWEGLLWDQTYTAWELPDVWLVTEKILLLSTDFYLLRVPAQDMMLNIFPSSSLILLFMHLK